MKNNKIINTNSKDTSAFKVTIHIPDTVSDSVKQQKINKLYDILKPKKETAA
jgi:hypothetical protein